MSRPPTSTAAFTQAMTYAPRVRDRILALIRERRGLTDDEIEVATGLSHQCVSARTGELRRDGLLLASRETRRTRQGRQATVWRVPDYLEGACPHCLGRGCLAPGCGGAACASQ